MGREPRCEIRFFLMVISLEIDFIGTEKIIAIHIKINKEIEGNVKKRYQYVLEQHKSSYLA